MEVSVNHLSCGSDSQFLTAAEGADHSARTAPPRVPSCIRQAGLSLGEPILRLAIV